MISWSNAAFRVPIKRWSDAFLDNAIFMIIEKKSKNIGPGELNKFPKGQSLNFRLSPIWPFHISCIEAESVWNLRDTAHTSEIY
jgi:hypothetical protein